MAVPLLQMYLPTGLCLFLSRGSVTVSVLPSPPAPCLKNCAELFLRYHDEQGRHPVRQPPGQGKATDHVARTFLEEPWGPVQPTTGSTEAGTRSGLQV